MKFLIVDSREKPKAIKTILKTFDREGIEYIISKLPFGDYMDWNNPGIVIDRKQNIAELAKNCTSDHVRFRNELELAMKAGTKIIVLVEQNRYRDRDEWIIVETIEDLLRWSNPYTTIRGEKVYRVLASWCSKYPLEVQFCDKRSTGRRIIELL